MHKQGGYEQTVLFVATDGSPSDREAVKKAIVDITNDVKDERELWRGDGNAAPRPSAMPARPGGCRISGLGADIESGYRM